MKLSKFPVGTLIRIGEVVVQLDSYVRADPRFINVTIVQSGDKIVIDGELLSCVMHKLSPLETLAHQANTTGTSRVVIDKR